jgi:hypothetical protein
MKKSTLFDNHNIKEEDVASLEKHVCKAVPGVASGSAAHYLKN